MIFHALLPFTVNPVILIVEDEGAIQDLLSINLQRGGYRVLVADSAERALALVQQALPDLVLLDWMLPGLSGIDLVRRWRADNRTRTLPIIMLTARGEEEAKLKGLETGADDYITKPFSIRELEARIKALLRRRTPQLSEETIHYHSLQLDPTAHRTTGGGKTLPMAPTEFRLLHFFMTHPERVYTRTQLLDFVWGDHVFIDERTVDVHIRRLRLALQPGGCADLIQTVRGIGYRFAAE